MKSIFYICKDGRGERITTLTLTLNPLIIFNVSQNKSSLIRKTAFVLSCVMSFDIGKLIYFLQGYLPQSAQSIL